MLTAAAAAFAAIALALFTTEWGPMWLRLLAAACAGGAVVVLAAERRRERREQLLVVGPLSEADPYTLGVEPEIGPEELEGHTWTYIRRDADDELKAVLEATHDGRGAAIVVLYGRSKLGKTRRLFEAAREEFRDNPLVVPKDVTALRARLQDRGWGATGRTLFWLDDLEDFVQVEGGVRFEELKDAVTRGAIVLATAGGKGGSSRGGTSTRSPGG